jgi:HPt (histidine-containing phosphotransfer) domain-containing protein
MEQREENSKSIDYRQLKQLEAMAFDDPGFMQSMIDEFIVDTTQSIKAIETAFSTADRAQLYTVSHTLKSTAKLFGANALADTCEYLELNADEIGQDEFLKQAHLLSEQFNSTKMALQTYRDNEMR